MGPQALPSVESSASQQGTSGHRKQRPHRSWFQPRSLGSGLCLVLAARPDKTISPPSQSLALIQCPWGFVNKDGTQLLLPVYLRLSRNNCLTLWVSVSAFSLFPRSSE